MVRTVGPRPSSQHRNAQALAHRAFPTVEALESRLTPYAVSGNVWPNPQLITIGFMPNGTSLGASVTNNLPTIFNAKFGSTSAWENVILKAAQVWAQQTNINFALVTDPGTASGSGNYQQGDPNMPDIRIAGYNFNNSSILAEAFQPPPANNYSIAGDIVFNTGQTFNLGTTYDLFTVACHEIGHALGMMHSTVTSSAIMWASYTGVKTALNSDDIAGIRDIYSSNNPRSYDSYYGAATPNNSFANAANISSVLSSSTLAGVVPNLDISTTSEAEYFTVTAPTGTTSQMTLTVQSKGLSLLSPEVTVYGSNETTVLGSANGLGLYGTTLTVTLSGVTAGEQLYLKVQGADTTCFSTGDYAMTLNFGSGASPTVSLPNTEVLNGSPLTSSGGVAANQGSPGSDYLEVSAPTGMTVVIPFMGAGSTDGVAKVLNFYIDTSGPIRNSVMVFVNPQEAAAAGNTGRGIFLSPTLALETLSLSAGDMDSSGVVADGLTLQV